MGPLNGIRVLDLTWIMAGPRATQLLAFLGAECIKIESELSPDLFRNTYTSGLGNERATHLGFAALNAGKKSIRLNLKHPEGKKIFERLVTISHIIVDNFTPGTMAKFGLDYHHLKGINPKIIMVSLSSHGASGPENSYRGYAVQFGPLSGMSYLTGYCDGPPEEIRSGADARVSIWTVFATLAALNYQQKTGKGQFVDISARECLTSEIGDAVMEYTMNKKVPTRHGNGDDSMAPNNCYPCKGTDKWISIAVASDEEWHAFCGAIGNPGWCRDDKFSTQSARWQNQEEMDKYISTWTIAHTHWEVMHILQSVGVAAVPSFSNQDLCEDPHCKKRDLFLEIDDPVEGKYKMLAPPWKLSVTPATVNLPSPGLGEHTDYVLQGLLGLSKREINRLQEEKILV